MTSVELFRLHELLGVVVAAEKARLAGVLARRDACRHRAGLLRGEISAPAGLPAAGAAGPAAAELAAVARWCLRLAARARTEEVRAAELEVEAEAIRVRLARAAGREAALGALAEKARKEERRLAERRAEGALPLPQRLADQSSVSSATSGGGDSAGSPGIA